jgi:hypothetical protein
MFRLYPKHIIPDYFEEFDRNIWSEEIDKIKEKLKPEASPGVPYHLMANTNKELMRKMGANFNEIVLDRIETRLRYAKEIPEWTREEMIDYGICDPVKVFVKDEPHKLKKLEEGRVRLIMSVSIIDKVIEMLLSQHLHKREIMMWETIPSKPGIGFTEDNNQSVYSDVMSRPNMAFADISGWDWSCKMWLLQECCQGKIRSCRNVLPVWQTLVELEPVIEGRSIYQFSDGTLVEPLYEGIVNSGKYKTSRDNSWMRVFLSFLVGAEDCIAAGDDTVETYVDQAPSIYKLYGWNLKDYRKITSGFEFCSRWYQDGKSFPLNLDKALMNLLHSKPKDVYEYALHLSAFTDEMKFHPEFRDIILLIDKAGYQPGDQGT